MNEKNKHHKILADISLRGLMRIDAALEGNWNPTVTTVWTKEKGFIGFGGAAHSDPDLKPSLELYFKDRWIGLHCYKKVGMLNMFDETLAGQIIEYIEKRMRDERGAA